MHPIEADCCLLTNRFKTTKITASGGGIVEIQLAARAAVFDHSTDRERVPSNRRTVPEQEDRLLSFTGDP